MAARKRPVNSGKRITAEVIATHLGVSVMTVSRAMNGLPNVDKKTRQRVLEAAEKFGYIPDHIARSLAIRRTETIGVVVPEITHSFFPEVIRGIEDAAYSSGYHLVLAHSAEDAERERDGIRTLQSKRVDGLLISVAQTARSHTVYKDIIRLGIPVVFFDRVVRGIGASCVSIDDEKCSCLAAEHLIGHGYKAIAHLSGPPTISIGKDRLKGFTKALEKHGMKYRPELVVQSGFDEKGGYEAMERLLLLPGRERPDAVVAVNDPAAFGAMKAVREHGLRIPQDMGIVGMSDDVRAELVYSPLTTVRQPAYVIGKTAAETLLAEIEGKSEPGKKIIVQTVLTIRKSCGCL